MGHYFLDILGIYKIKFYNLYSGHLNYWPELDWRSLGDAEESDAVSEESREEGQREPNIKLYIVVACIAALVLVAVMQVNIT